MSQKPVILHVISETSNLRAQKLVWPLCSKGSNHFCIYLSSAQPMLRLNQVHWLERKNKVDKNLFFSVAQKINELSPDVLHIHGVDDLLMLVTTLKKGSYKKVVSIFRGESRSWIEKTFNRLKGQVLRWADVVCFPTHKMEELYVSSGFPYKKARILIDGCVVPRIPRLDIESFKFEDDFSVSKQTFFIAVPGTFKKNEKTWIKAIEAISPNIRPHVVLLEGDYNLWQKDIKSLKLNKYFHKIKENMYWSVAQKSCGGIVGSQQPSPLFSEMELLHMGIPLIGPTGGGLMELVISHFNGFLCHPKRIQSWMHGYKWTASFYDKNIKLKRAAKAMGYQAFTVDRWKSEAEEIYSQLK